MINYKELEEKWQKAWDEAKIFEPEISDRKSLLVTAAIPYVNNPPHMGHFRTYGTPDTYARYMRMRGYNVLFPFGFHATGTPVLAYAKRVRNNDLEIIEDLKRLHVSDSDIQKMADPEYIAEYFIKQQESELRKAGIGIDWRRKFITTEPLFSRLVEWQFARLKDKGYLTKGTHPVGWCTNENSAVGQHDTKHDVQPKIEKVTAVKFKDSQSDAYFPCATYRPETIYGVTNIFVNDQIVYVLAEINGEQFYLSKDAAAKLSMQFNITVKNEINGSELLSRSVINPVTKETVPILPGFFVKSDTGTGVVMSVPAHAPFDYAALQKLKKSGVAVPENFPKVVSMENFSEKIGKSSSKEEIKSRGKAVHLETPALAYLEFINSEPSFEDDVLELATALIYKEESRWGIMDVGKYKGKSETQARELIKDDLIASKDAISIYELTNPEPVICRCGTKAVINTVKEQWFINYGDKKWKEDVKSMFPDVRVIPEKYRRTFEVLFDWIDVRATERAQGLGTRFPYNPEHIIESLSDSTIYMVFYTFVQFLRANDIKPEQLKPEFFDYIINSVGKAEDVASSTGISISVINNCKDSMDYWYKETSRHSAPDLIPNHYVMYIFNHVALFPKKFWPKQIVTNGFVNYEGEKMSKSLGNIISMGDSVDKFGSDPIRFQEITGAGLDTDTEFNVTSVNGILSKNEALFGYADQLQTMRGVELEHIDYWLYSKLNSKINKATSYMDKLQFHEAYNDVYYNSMVELKWYLDRGGHNEVTVRDFLESVTLMITPIMPHFAEELWHRLGNNTLAAKAQWPVCQADMINEKTEIVEDIIIRNIDDIANTMALSSKIDANKGKSVKQIKVIIADDWKREAINSLIKHKDISKVIAEKGLKDVGKEKIAKFVSPLMKRLMTMQPLPEIDSSELFEGFVNSRGYMKKRFGAEVLVEKESESKSSRAERALPDKPSIEIVWG
ncbi:MAG: leucine--tRNA ligase [Candidatus Marsarchaeota archaeon]|nr:leucine--tRNA ligase [Candidatus Marsarchaeota archaeon]